MQRVLKVSHFNGLLRSLNHFVFGNVRRQNIHLSIHWCSANLPLFNDPDLAWDDKFGSRIKQPDNRIEGGFARTCDGINERLFWKGTCSLHSFFVSQILTCSWTIVSDKRFSVTCDISWVLKLDNARPIILCRQVKLMAYLTCHISAIFLST